MFSLGPLSAVLYSTIELEYYAIGVRAVLYSAIELEYYAIIGVSTVLSTATSVACEINFVNLCIVGIKNLFYRKPIWSEVINI